MSDFVIENDVLVEYTGQDQHVVIPDGVSSIGDSAFEWCESLESVVIPYDVISIGRAAFRDCINLTDVSMPELLICVGAGAFDGTPWLARQSLPLVAGGVLIRSKSGEENEAVIPQGVDIIGDCAFKGCTDLTSVVIPDGVTDIGAEAFAGCSSLTSVVISDDVLRIGDGVFSGCSSLTRIAIPGSVKSIGKYAFSDCKKLMDIDIPDSVKSICEHAFSGCESLSSIRLPSALGWIGDSAFACCSSLTGIMLPDSDVYVGSDAFHKCSSLTHVSIPDTVRLAARTFEGCSALRYIQTGARLPVDFDWAWEEHVPIVTEDPLRMPFTFRPHALIGYAEEPSAPGTPRAEAHMTCIRYNAAKLIDLAFSHPELLHLMLDCRLLSRKVTRAYLSAAIERGMIPVIAELLAYQTRLRHAKDADKHKE